MKNLIQLLLLTAAFTLVLSSCVSYNPSNYSLVSDNYKDFQEPECALTTVVVKNHTDQTRYIYLKEQASEELGFWFEVEPARKFLGLTLPRKTELLVEPGELVVLSDANLTDSLHGNFRPCMKYTTHYEDVPFAKSPVPVLEENEEFSETR